eukprot:1143835-Pelagomonas_calceolata.AAC.1
MQIRATAHAMGVSSELAPFTVGFNVFGSMALLTVSFRYSFESVCKKWASKQVGCPGGDVTQQVLARLRVSKRLLSQATDWWPCKQSLLHQILDLFG